MKSSPLVSVALNCIIIVNGIKNMEVMWMHCRFNYSVFSHCGQSCICHRTLQSNVFSQGYPWRYFIGVPQGDRHCIICFADVKCGATVNYHECGRSCMSTCLHPNPERVDKTCYKGCFCEDDMVMDPATGECLEHGECGCKVNGKDQYVAVRVYSHAFQIGKNASNV